MASSIKLSDTINWASPFLRYMPITAGVNNEPAVSNANTILQTIVGAPFAWSWNRATATFATVAGQQDYVVTAADFGYIEKASVAVSGTEKYELDPDKILGDDATPGRPGRIAVQMDDDAGHITFRVMPVPEVVYNINVTYQRSAPLFTALNQTWAPIPDRYSYIVNYGFLAMAQMYCDDPRYQITNAKFVHALLSAAEGLDQTDKDLFVQRWLGNDQSAAGSRTMMGIQARSS